MRECPKCGNRLHDTAVGCPVCGDSAHKTSTGKPIDPKRFLCCYEEQGERCGNLGTLADTTVGFGGKTGNENQRWYCHQHFPAFRNWKRGRRDPMPPGWRNRLPATLQKIDAEALAEHLAIEAECQTNPELK